MNAMKYLPNHFNKGQVGSHPISSFMLTLVNFVGISAFQDVFPLSRPALQEDQASLARHQVMALLALFAVF
jgi:hypothetical protein